MPSEYSFDIISKIDLQEVDNGVNQTKKIVLTRYDLKGSKCEVNFDRKENKIQVIAEDKMKYATLLDILKERLAARNVPLKSLKYGNEEQGIDGSVRQTIEFQMGIPTDIAKEINKSIRDLGLKVQPQIQSDQIRVTGKSKDDLQTVMNFLKQKDLSIPLQFSNFR